MKTVEEIKSRMGLGALAVLKHREAPTGQEVSEFRKTLLTDLKEISASGSAELIVAMEEAIVENDLKYYANSDAMRSSLETALNEFEIVKRQLDIVDDPERYKATDQSFSRPRNRSKGLPIDEARQIFKSHFTRLVNMDKSPLDDLEKQIIEVRKSAIHRAQKQYIERQAKTLGVELPGKK